MPREQFVARLNNKVLEKLEKFAPKKKLNVYVDEVLSHKLGIIYEEAYPEDVEDIKNGKKKRKWIGVFKE